MQTLHLSRKQLPKLVAQKLTREFARITKLCPRVMNYFRSIQRNLLLLGSRCVMMT